MISDTYHTSELDCVLWKLRHEPADLVGHLQRAAGFLGAKRAFERAARRPPAEPGYAVHYGMHFTGDNAGDMALYIATSALFDHFQIGGPWQRLPLRREVTVDQIEEFNARARFILVGGGGLLLPDVTDRCQSGWQWPCPLDVLRQLKVPLVVFAIGFNKFRGQDDFAPVFRENLRRVVEQSLFFGLRNTGSIRRTAEYLPPELHGKLRYQPCPTTVLHHFWPYSPDAPAQPEEDLLALNVAVDRAGNRFGDRLEGILRGIVEIGRWATQQGWRLRVVTHARSDAVIQPELKRAGVSFEATHLERRSGREVIEFYRRPALTVGMRGHAQMIPFGNGNAIVSLISHNKMAYFLEDIGRPEWGVELMEDGFVEKAKAQIAHFQGHRGEVRAAVAAARDKLWTVTKANMDAIRAGLGGPRA